MKQRVFSKNTAQLAKIKKAPLVSVIGRIPSLMQLSSRVNGSASWKARKPKSKPTPSNKHVEEEWAGKHPGGCIPNSR